MNVGVQPHTLGSLEESTARNIARVATSRYDGIELSARVTDDATDRLAATGLDVSSVGTSFERVSEDMGTHEDACEAYGTSAVVIMWVSPEDFESVAAVEETASELDRLATELADRGLTLHYHNHDHEFVEVGGRPALEVLYEHTDHLHFELDLGWAGAGGVDPASMLERLGSRVTHVHIKDMDFDERAFVTFGEGDLDIEGAIDAARDVGVEWVLFENDDPLDPIAEISHASLLLDEHIGHISG